MAVTIVAVAVGAAVVYVRDGSHTSLLYFFYLPVAATAVVLGRMVGLLLALAAAVGVAVPSIWFGLSHLVPEDVNRAEALASLAVWAVFLIATAWLVGWVSERGGSLSLTSGLGGSAIRAIEQERRRTGQDIHDGIAQYAAAAFLEAEVLAELAKEAQPPIKEQMDRVKQSLSSLVRESRAMVGNLRPPPLGPGEFPSSFTELIEAFKSRTGVSCDAEIEGDMAGHTDSMRICIYRATQEALSNIERHSEATAARVWVRAGKGGVQLLVWDNGKGFAQEKAGNGNGNGGHFGLSGIRERAGYLGGRVSVRTAPGEGTSIVLYVPTYRGGRNARSRTKH